MAPRAMEEEPAAGPAQGAGQDAWEQAANCALCSAVLGKRHLNPRHHCRICSRCVCGPCSPSTVRLRGERALQRACEECVGHARNADITRNRLYHVGAHLHAIGGRSDADAEEVIESLEQAVAFCERMRKPLQEMYEECLSLQHWVEHEADPEIVQLLQGHACSSATTSGDSLDSAMLLCEAIRHISERTLEYGGSRCSTALASQEATSSRTTLPEKACVCGDAFADDAARCRSCGAIRTEAANTTECGERRAPPCTSAQMAPPRVWEEDTEACRICDAAFCGLNRRHHCRICGRCICSSCSSCTVKFSDEKTLQRVCTVCIGNAQDVCVLRPRIAQLSIALTACYGADTADLSPSASLCDALAACEATVVPLESLRRRRQALDALERRVKAEAEKRRREKGRHGNAVMFNPDANLIRSWGDLDDRYAASAGGPVGFRGCCKSSCALL